MDEAELTKANINPQKSLDYTNVENEWNMIISLTLDPTFAEKKIRSSILASSTNTRNAILFRNGKRHVSEMFLNKFLLEYQARVTQEHSEERVPYLD